MLSNCRYCSSKKSHKMCDANPTYFNLFTHLEKDFRGPIENPDFYDSYFNTCPDFVPCEEKPLSVTIDETDVKLLIEGIITPELRHVLEARLEGSIELIPVESSNLAAIGYDPQIKSLYVKFNNGSLYEYKNVEQEAFDALEKSPSKGQHLNSVIKPYGYFYERLY